MENYQVKDNLTFQLKANGLDQEVVFFRRWVDVLWIMLDSYSIIWFGWSLLTGGLYGGENQSEISNLPPFHSNESRCPHISYAHWVPIHLSDLKSLSSAVKNHFISCWVLRKPTSFLAFRLTEQNYELVKGSGRAVGLTENLKAFRRWMVAGPGFWLNQRTSFWLKRIHKGNIMSKACLPKTSSQNIQIACMKLSQIWITLLWMIIQNC